MSSSASALLLCLNCQRYEFQLPLLRSARTFKGLKLCFRNSALSLLPKIWSSAFHTSARPGLRRSRSSSALVLSGLPNMGKATSAFHPCRDFQRCEVPLPHFCQRSEVPLYVLPLGQDFERSTLVLPGLPNMDVHFRISSLPGPPKIWSSASALLLCLDCQRCEVLLPQFRRTFLLCIPTQLCTVLVFRETSQVKIETT